MAKRVVQVCSAHPSDDGRVFQRTCRALAEAGYEVHLIATDPAPQAYERHGVTIHPLEHVISSRERIRRRHQVARMAAELRPDILHVHEPELLGPVIKSSGQTPVIFDAHELYVEVLLDREWLPRWIRPVARAAWDVYERWLLRQCVAVFAATEGVAARYRPLHPRTIVLANFPDLREHLAMPAPARSGRDCVFSGTLSENRGLFEMLDAFRLLADRGVAATLHIAGKGSAELMQRLDDRVEMLDLRDRVRVSGPFAREDGTRMANEASIGMVPHLPYGNNLVAWPVKMLDYLALGLPLVYSNLPCHIELLAGAEVGNAVEPTPTQIADAVQKLVEDPALAARLSANAREVAASRLNWGVEKQKLLDLYQIVAPLEHRPADSAVV